MNLNRLAAGCILAIPALITPALAQSWTSVPHYTSQGLAEAFVEDPHQVAAMIEDLRKALSYVGIKAMPVCKMAVTEAVTTSKMGNVSYGFYCGISGAKYPDDRVLLCYDEMVGHVAVDTVYPMDGNLKAIRDRIALFTTSHCVGG